jgi:hypothetical protein
VVGREECAKPPFKVPKGYEPPPRLTDHVCAKLDECERFVGDRCEHLGCGAHDNLFALCSW